MSLFFSKKSKAIWQFNQAEDYFLAKSFDHAYTLYTSCYEVIHDKRSYIFHKRCECLFNSGKYNELLNISGNQNDEESIYFKAVSAFKLGNSALARKLFLDGKLKNRNRFNLLLSKYFNLDFSNEDFWNPLELMYKIEFQSEIGMVSYNENYLPTNEELEKLFTKKILNLNYRIENNNPSSYYTKFKPYKISTVVPLRCFKELKYLTLSGQEDLSLNGIEKCNNLIELNLSHTKTSDLSMLKYLIKLKYLNLHCYATHSHKLDLAPISELLLLEMDLTGNDIKDFVELQKITSLKRLSLKGTNIENFEQISDLINLEFLDVSLNENLDFFRGIAHFPKLRVLYADNLTDKQKDNFYTVNPLSLIYCNLSSSMYVNNSIIQSYKESSISNVDEFEAVKNNLGHHNRIKKLSELIQNNYTLQDFPKVLFPLSFLTDIADFTKQSIKRPVQVTDALNTKGISEEYFEKYLSNSMGSALIKNAVFSIGEKYLPSVPDFVIYLKESNLCLDIEIDEPYVWHLNKPTHFHAYDVDRDFSMLYENWFIIRFTEEQVVIHPNECIQFIVQLIDYIKDCLKMKLYRAWESKFEYSQKSWSEANCKSMMLQDYRKGYLLKFIDIRTESSIAKTLYKANEDTFFEAKWNKVDLIWKGAILESVFSRSIDQGVFLSENEIKYLLQIELLDFSSTDTRNNRLRPNKLESKLESLYGIENLAFLTNIKKINLSHNLITNIDPITSFLHINSLILDDNPLQEIDCLNAMVNLHTLHFSYTDVKNLNFIKDLLNINDLSCVKTGIYDISPLYYLNNPQSISLFDNRLKKTQVEKLISLFPMSEIKYSKSHLVNV